MAKIFKTLFNPRQHSSDKSDGSQECQIMFHAKSLRDLLKTVPLTEDFFSDLDPFQLNYIEMCFKKSLDEQIGMMSQTEYTNYQIFLRYKSEYEEEFYPEIKNLKKAS
jgi:hypothetical protein